MKLQQFQAMRLMDRLRAQIRLRHFSLRTEEAYTGWVRRYIVFHGKRNPDQMGEGEIRDFLSFLASQRNVAALNAESGIGGVAVLVPRGTGPSDGKRRCRSSGKAAGKTAGRAEAG